MLLSVEEVDEEVLDLGYTSGAFDQCNGIDVSLEIIRSLYNQVDWVEGRSE